MITVYIPNYNHGLTLGRAIRSAVINNPDEVVVIEDCSTDTSLVQAQLWADTVPSVRVVQNQTKSADWQHEAAKVFRSFKGEHIIGMGADDILLPGAVESTKRFLSAPIVFHDYVTIDAGGRTVGDVPMGVADVTPMTPGEVVARFRSPCNPTETGIGSSIRADRLKWLCNLQYWRMGPWSDCIGYAAVAALYGCVYVPQVAAGFTVNEAGYGRSSIADPVASKRYAAGVRQFLQDAGIDSTTAMAMMAKRGVPDEL
jgi:glycosyltransferase involved in cell wall biosynthesis